eukprot:TRINITY_DN14951_c0_g1_i1.p1 TRINITY_DN14951_c0_g1~~TRINITY_DN14951_c0_g1_i1.p1  ORF type:complete len:428 (+),score=57.36 TRINITY_DN14951_c0_g1_i1:147-1430(+)
MHTTGNNSRNNKDADPQVEANLSTVVIGNDATIVHAKHAAKNNDDDPERGDIHSRQRSQEVVLCCGITLSWLSRRSKVTVVIAGVFFSFLVFFIFEEMLIKHTRFGESPGFVGVACVFASFVNALIEYILFFRTPRKGPLHYYCLMGFFTGIETFTAQYSLGLLNFPTWVVFRSSGLLTTMMGSIVLLNKRFQLHDYLRALLLICGLVFFALGDVAAHISFNKTGIVLVVVSLFFNSCEVNMQEQLLHQYGVQRNEVMLYGPMFSVVFMSITLITTGEMQRALISFADNPFDGFYLAIGVTVSSFGVALIVSLVKLTNAVTAAIVTSLRKAFTITISFLIYSKPWSSRYLIGGMLLAVGTAWEIYSRMKSKTPTKTSDHMLTTTTTSKTWLTYLEELDGASKILIGVLVFSTPAILFKAYMDYLVVE